MEDIPEEFVEDKLKPLVDLERKMDIPYEKTLADLFRWRVAESGEDVAHKFIDKETTYAERFLCK